MFRNAIRRQAWYCNRVKEKINNLYEKLHIFLYKIVCESYITEINAIPKETEKFNQDFIRDIVLRWRALWKRFTVGKEMHRLKWRRTVSRIRF